MRDKRRTGREGERGNQRRVRDSCDGAGVMRLVTVSRCHAGPADTSRCMPSLLSLTKMTADGGSPDSADSAVSPGLATADSGHQSSGLLQPCTHRRTNGSSGLKTDWPMRGREM